MDFNEQIVIEFEKKWLGIVIPLFKPNSKLHHKWYGIKNDKSTQFGTIHHLLQSEPDQVIFETYDHGKPKQVEVFFFDKKLKQTQGILFKSGWILGRRISDESTDKYYEITDPSGVRRKMLLNSNLYSQVFKSNIPKLISQKSF